MKIENFALASLVTAVSACSGPANPEGMLRRIPGQLLTREQLIQACIDSATSAKPILYYFGNLTSNTISQVAGETLVTRDGEKIRAETAPESETVVLPSRQGEATIVFTLNQSDSTFSPVLQMYPDVGSGTNVYIECRHENAIVVAERSPKHVRDAATDVARYHATRTSPQPTSTPTPVGYVQPTRKPTSTLRPSSMEQPAHTPTPVAEVLRMTSTPMPPKQGWSLLGRRKLDILD